jgi:hypothetical protein
VHGESAWLLLTAGVAAAGLFALFRRVRLEFDRTIAAFAAALVAMATPLLGPVVYDPDPVGVLAFAVVASGNLLGSTMRRGKAQSVTFTVGATLLALALTRNREPHATLFSASGGFLALWPVAYVAALATLVTARHRVAEAVGLLLMLALFAPLRASLLPALALSAPGLAATLDFARRRPLLAAAPLVLSVVIWNYWLMVQYTAGSIPKDAPFSFAAMVRQQADVHTRAPYVYPFAIPGNVIAAWQQGIPLGRYDALAAEPLREAFEITLDRSADRFLLDGWGAAGANAAGAFRPVARRATVLVPLSRVNAAVDIEVVFTAPDASPLDLGIELNGASAGALHISQGFPHSGRLRIPADRVGTMFRTGYNRLSIVHSAATRPAIHRLRITPAT